MDSGGGITILGFGILGSLDNWITVYESFDLDCWIVGLDYWIGLSDKAESAIRGIGY